MAKMYNIFSNKPIKENKLKILVDNREKNSLVVSELSKLGIIAEFKHLPVADYLVSDIAIERKTILDFKSSIMNKRLMQQLLELKQYPKHFLILEGIESTDPYSGGIHENAFRGFLLSILFDYKVPIIFTLNEKDTAKYISVLAKKHKKTDTSIRASKTFLDEKEQLQFILEGFPGIGGTTAKKLLEHFKTINQIANSTEDELKSIIGKKAETLYKLITYEY